MAGPGGVVIGRISVRVLPDTSQFRRKLYPELKKIEKNAKVKVGVVADTRQFVKDVHRAVKEVQAFVRDAITINLRLDSRDFERAFRALEKDLSDRKVRIEAVFDGANLQSALSKIRDDVESIKPKIKPDLKLDTDEAERQADWFSRWLERRAAPHIAVKLDYEKQVASVEKELAGLEREYGNLESKLKLAVDAGSKAQIKRDLDAIAKQVDKALDARDQIQLEFDADPAMKSLKKIEDKLNNIDDFTAKPKIRPDMANGTLKVVQASLAWLTRDRTVDIFVNVNKASFAAATTAIAALSGARVVMDWGDDFYQGLKELDKSTPKIAVMSAALATASAAVGELSIQALALGGALVKATGAGLALPGILGGMAIGVGITIRAFRDWKTELKSVDAAFKSLGKMVSTNFWAKARAPITEMFTTLLPELRKGLGESSTAIGSFFGTLAKNLQGSLKGQMGPMFDNLTKSINISAKGTEYFAKAIAVLGRQGSSYLPRLATWYNNVQKAAADWLVQAEKSGRLKEIIEQGITTLRMFGQAIVAVGGMFKALWTAATPFFSEVVGGLQSMSDAMNSTAGQTQLTSLFGALHEGWLAFWNAASPGLSAFALALNGLAVQGVPDLAHAFGTLVDGIAAGFAQPVAMEGLAKAIAGIKQGIDNLAPSLPLIGELFGALGPVVGALATQIGSVFNAVLPMVTAAIAGLAPHVTNLITLLGTNLTSTLTSVQPYFSQFMAILGNVSAAISLIDFGPLAEQVRGILTSAFNTAKTVFLSVAEAVKPIVLAFAELAPKLLEVGQTIMSAIAPAFERAKGGFQALGEGIAMVLQWLGPIIPILGQVGAAVIELAGYLIEKLGPAFKELVVALTPVANFLGTVLVAAFKILVPVITFVVKMIIDSIAGIASGLANIISGLTGIVSGIWGIISGLFTMIVGIFTLNGEKIKSGWKSMWDGIVNILRGIWDLIKGIVETAWNVAMLLPIMKGFQLLKAGFAAGWAGIRAAMSVAWDTIKALFTGKWADFLAGASILWDGVKVAWTAAWNAIKVVLSAIWTGLRAAWTGFGAAMKTVGIAIWDGVKIAWTATWTALRAVLQGIWTGIRVTFTAIWTGIKAVASLVWSGVSAAWTATWTTIRTVLTAVWNGLRATFTAVWTGIKAVASAVWNGVSATWSAVWAGIRATLTAVWNGIRATATATWNGIRASASAAWNGIRSVISAAINGIRTAISNGLSNARTVATVAWNAIRSGAITAWNAIRSAVSSAINAVRSSISSGLNAARSVATSAWNAIRSSASSAWNGIRSLISSAMSAVRSVITSGLNAARAAASAAWNAIRSSASAAWSAIRSTISSAMSSVRSAISSGMNAAKQVVSAAWSAMKATFNAGKSAVIGIVRGIPGAIRGALGNLGGLLTGAGRALMDGLISGIKGGIGKLSGVLGGITKMIPKKKGPPKRDAVLLTPAGQLIMQSLINGISAGESALSNKLTSVTQGIGESLDALSLRQVGKGMFTDLAGGMQSRMRAVTGVLDGVTAAVDDATMKSNIGVTASVVERSNIVTRDEAKAEQGKQSLSGAIELRNGNAWFVGQLNTNKRDVSRAVDEGRRSIR